MLRSLVIGQLGHYGDTDTIQEAQKRFSDYCSGGSSLPADLKAAVFSTCLANGDGSTFDQLLKVSRSHPLHVTGGACLRVIEDVH